MRSICSLLGIFIAICSTGQVEYISPLFGSAQHNPEVTITVRLDAETADQIDGLEFVIASTSADVVEHEVIRTSDPRTIILDPITNFEYGDFVAVFLRRCSMWNPLITQFTIREEPAPEFKELEEIIPMLRGGGMPGYSIDVNTSPTPWPIFFKNSGAIGDRYWGIIDNSGTPINTFQENDKGFDFKLNESGYLTMFDDVPEHWLVMDSSFNPIDTVTMGNGYITDNHEIIHMANGNSLIMAYDWQIIDMSAIVAGGDPAANVKGTILQEVDDAGNVLFEWRTWDHFQITDGNVDMTASSISYSHGNSIERDANGNLLVSFRNMDEITYIDGTTGDIIWRLGGQNNMFTITNDPDGFVRQHDARWVSPTNMTIYDNGELHSTPLAAAKEYLIDTLTWTADLVWRFDHPLGVASQRTGNVQRLSNGNTFINWGKRDDVSWPNWTEVNPFGGVVFEFRFTGGTSYNTYRAHRYEWSIPTEVDELPADRITMYPNPARDEYNIELDEEGTLEIFSIGGSLVMSGILRSGNNSIDISDLTLGIYTVVVTTDGSRSVNLLIVE